MDTGGTADDSTTGGATDAGSTSGGSTGGGTGSVYECDAVGPFGEIAAGAYDCQEVCVSLIYHQFALVHPAGLWTDGNCDDAGPYEYADFNCAEFGFDYGDCPAS